jgi:hypothetical protein
MAKRKLTEKDFKDNPDLLYKKGLVIGDEIEIPEGDEQNLTNETEEGSGEGADDGDDTGGSNPPPDKERPQRP